MRLDGGCTEIIGSCFCRKVNAWATKAYISGSFRAGTDISVEYRVKGNEEWTKLDNSAITETGSTSYSAELTGLQSGTDYEVRALAGGSEGDVYSFQTETIVTLPNMNFDTWTQDGKTWYPNPVADNLDDPQAYWATGNEGVTIYKESSTVPVTGSDAYKGTAAKCIRTEIFYWSVQLPVICLSGLIKRM